MPTTVIELVTGPRISRRKKIAEFDYLLRGTEDSAAAEADLEAAIDPDFEGWPLDDIRIESGGNERLWRARVIYQVGGGGGAPPPETNEVRFAFDTGGGVKILTHALEHLQDVAESGPAPNHNGAINVTKDGPQGVEVVVANYGFTATKYVANSDIAAARTAAFACTGHTNDDNFLGFAAGEVLLLRVTGAPRSAEDYEVVYQFLANQNKTSWEPVPGFTGVNKKGWEYLWVEHAETVDGNHAVVTPIAVHVERVYDEADFDALELE